MALIAPKAKPDLGPQETQPNPTTNRSGRFFARRSRIDWYDPDPRSLLPLSAEQGLHIPRRLVRTVRQRPYRITTDTAFRAVLHRCADPSRPGPWIDHQIIALSTLLQEAGHAHSIEAWDAHDQLVGGLYGVAIPGSQGPIFCAESMFTDFAQGRDASKVCLVHLIYHLRAHGYTACDVQLANSHTAQFGVYDIPREQYHTMLDLPPPPPDAPSPGRGNDALVSLEPVAPCPWLPLTEPDLSALPAR